ncbi:MAG TPA: transglutaminase family protein, partial [Polyangiales bacterium]|nr:transglutaminase family protein [Polyangiales bacterium]
GFIGLDATNGLLTGEGHIPLACSPDPRSAAPITGSFGFEPRDEDDKVKEHFGFDMRVLRIEDRPRPTKPLTPDQWRALCACGDHVERELQQQDVRLSMGGEPTFVAASDPEGDEWNTTASGPTKRGYADRLIRRLERRFAPGGVLHHGQGKWYPGEPLPRWAFSCYFRRDGEPLWNDPSLIAHDDDPAGHGVREAELFAKSLAKRLGVDPAHVQAGFEDVFYYLWRERRLPVNVDPFESKLENPEDRERLRRVFERGLQTEVGFALPLRASRTQAGLRWASGPWFLRAERMYLLPGDSAMGYRLPLDSLPWSAAGDSEQHFEIDPFAPRGALPSRGMLRLQSIGDAPREPEPEPEHKLEPDAAIVPLQSANGVVRTAICVEPRDGILHVFLPPLVELEAFVALIAALEETASELGLPIQLEGYHPPKDPRLERLQVTPDPGVIEVNIHPTRSWRDLVDVTTVLYAEAHECGLASEKFMVDGRHSGTGGGNHFTLGGPTAADSPFLRRPDLLRSLLSYWLDHPSLSYLFSGLFIGPTSQAPRLDEARHDSLYELEIAFDTLAAQQSEAPPWLVDRLFRHLLIDSSGNTHRTELCIDKMYSPDSSAGRQGLLELRAFEMPPDARMSCAAQLLVRALVAWFWRKPYTRKPMRWGTQLIDRFMLPHFIGQDFRDVLRDLRTAGFAFEAGWYEAQQEFRFPLLGRIAVDGIELELRQAIEPWHVLGEEAAGGATVRYVDSSVERLQVLARNLIGSRYVVTCNNRRVPLHPTGTTGEFVAGVRYRAWKPPTALHPTIEPHTPLVFELLDTWSEHALGGCTYHAVHPGGRAYHVFPTNALEAEARRASRFWPFGHSLGSRGAPPAEPNRDLPLTLDLRRAVK